MSHLSNSERSTACGMLMVRLRDVSGDVQQYADKDMFRAALDALHVGKEIFQQAEELLREAGHSGAEW